MAESWPLPTTSAVGDPNFVPDFNQARENMNGLHAREAIYGTGSPEGVVTATIGTRYVDTNATNGAVEWIKKSGTGNTGWEVVFGDTGSRTLVSWDTAGVVTGTLGADFAPRPGAAGGIYYRCRNGQITISITNLRANAASAAGIRTLCPLPSTARVENGHYAIPLDIPTGQIGADLYYDGANLALMAQAFTAGQVIAYGVGQRATLPLRAGTGWPNPLPGT